MANGQPQIQGVPPGVTLEPAPQTGAQTSGADTSNIQGVPPGVTLEAVPSTQQTAVAQPSITLDDVRKVSVNPQYPNAINPAFGEKLRSDPTFRQQVGSLRGQLDPGEQSDLEKAESEAQAKSEGGRSGLAGIATGITKEAGSTVEGLAGLANKVLPASMQIPTGPSSTPGKTPTQGFSEGIGGLAENIGEFAAGDEALKGVLKGVEILNKLPAGMRAVAEAHPRLLRTLISSGKAAVVGGAQGAVKGTTQGDTLGGAKAGAEGGAVGGVAGEIVPAFTQKLGAILEKYAPDFMNSMLRASKKANYLYGKNPGRAIIDEGISVPKSVTLAGQLENLHGQLESAGESLDGQIKQVLSQPSVAAKKQDIIPVIQNTIEAAKQHITHQTGIDTKAYLDELSKLQDNLLTKYDTDGNVIGTIQGARLAPSEISDVKKSIGKGTHWKLDPKDPAFQQKAYANSIRKQIYGQLADMVEQAAPGVNQLNSRYANVIEAQGLLENRIAQEHGTGGLTGALRKGEWGSGLGLIFAGHPYLGIPLIANRVIRSVPGRVLESQAASAAGKVMQSPTLGDVMQKAVTPAVANWIRVVASDGKNLEVHPEDLEELQKRDPGAKVVPGQNQ